MCLRIKPRFIRTGYVGATTVDAMRRHTHRFISNIPVHYSAIVTLMEHSPPVECVAGLAVVAQCGSSHQEWLEQDIRAQGAELSCLAGTRDVESSGPCTHSMIQLASVSAMEERAFSILHPLIFNPRLQVNDIMSLVGSLPSSEPPHALSPTITHPLLPLPYVQVATHATHCRSR